MRKIAIKFNNVNLIVFCNIYVLNKYKKYKN